MTTPTPTPTPSPTQTVVVNVPPDVVGKFAPHDDLAWINGPTATLIAGLLALIGAGIAFWAVNRQIRSNAKVVAEQITANADAVGRQIEANAQSVARQIEAAAAQQRREERLDLVTEAAHLVHDLAALATQYAAFGGDPDWLDEPSEVRQAHAEKEFDELIVWPVARRLDLLGMADAAEAVQAAYHEAYKIIHPSPYFEYDEEWTMYDLRDRAISELKRALDVL
ncbi:hypothetical protein [Mycobacterium sp. E796]|uniref:hypothetical protein n=1 Tax=Mycobacterium sp. E796 TaxID=1834151 RepID=UPI000ACF071F|nr:hypothetical protein [Mycobacterium sp. E796]